MSLFKKGNVVKKAVTNKARAELIQKGFEPYGEQEEKQDNLPEDNPINTSGETTKPADEKPSGSKSSKPKDSKKNKTADEEPPATENKQENEALPSSENNSESSESAAKENDPGLSTD